MNLKTGILDRSFEEFSRSIIVPVNDFKLIMGTFNIVRFHVCLNLNMAKFSSLKVKQLFIGFVKNSRALSFVMKHVSVFFKTTHPCRLESR